VCVRACHSSARNVNMDEETALVLGVQLLALCCIACSLVGICVLHCIRNDFLFLSLHERCENRDYFASVGTRKSSLSRLKDIILMCNGYRGVCSVYLKN